MIRRLKFNVNRLDLDFERMILRKGLLKISIGIYFYYDCNNFLQINSRRKDVQKVVIISKQSTLTIGLIKSDVKGQFTF